jgi:EpsD family peptidyl-prolyl cis-trans isomerase
MVAALALVPAFGGCGKSAETADRATQVAAKVNGDEITIHQINTILAKMSNASPESATPVKREVLDRLIDQHLARQHAMELKLDRSPKVMQALESARSEILSRAYMEELVAMQPKPTPEEVRQYYQAHPELFSRRRVFSIAELVIAPDSELGAQLRQRAASAGSLEEVANWLRSKRTKFNASRAVRTAEEIPMELLPVIQEMRIGQIGFTEVNGRPEVFQLLGAEEVPVDEATATPRIQQYLFNKRSTEALARELKTMRDKANIVYVGEFATPPSGSR